MKEERRQMAQQGTLSMSCRAEILVLLPWVLWSLGSPCSKKENRVSDGLWWRRNDGCFGAASEALREAELACTEQGIPFG